MAASEWFVIEGLDIGKAEFPVIVRLAGEDLLIFDLGQRLGAIQRWCPHQKADLAGGKLTGDMLKCPRHGFIFRLSDGRGVNCPGINARVFEVVVEEGKLKVRGNYGGA